MMGSYRWIIFVVVFEVITPLSSAEVKCYHAGGVAGIIIATIIVTIVVTGLSLAAAWRYWKRKKVHNRRPENQKPVPSEKTSGNFAFDNPYFKDQECDEATIGDKGKTRSSINHKSSLRSSKQSDLSTKGKKTRGNKSHFIFGGGGAGKKQRALDDSCLAVEPERTVVALRGHDFTGLGFNICGNMRDGILVKDVLHRGPASESGRIKAGDRIISVTVSFTNIVYEDALTILSYASPYDVQLELERIPDKTRAMQSSPAGSKRLGSCSFSGGGQKLFHPLYRSQSIDDLTQIDKDTFPSHGIGPRRSQSIGVAAHKLAAHFKHSDSRLEDKDRTATSVILSTTGSLNEKMLANVMAEGASKSGLHWEKRFEDTLESESTETNAASDMSESKRNTPSVNNKSVSSPKNSTSSVSDDRSDLSEDVSVIHQSALDAHSKQGNRESGTQKTDGLSKTRNETSNAEVKTTAQIHRFDDVSNRRAKTMAQASNALWQLDQSIKDVDSDLDISSSYPWNNNSNVQMSSRNKVLSSTAVSSETHTESNENKTGTLKTEADEDTDVSGDSLELGNKKRQNKRSKRRSSSLGDLTQLEESVNTMTEHENKSICMDSNSCVASDPHHHQKQQKKNDKNGNHKPQCNAVKSSNWCNSERNSCTDYYNNNNIVSGKQNGRHRSSGLDSSQLNKPPHSVYANSSVIHISNKEQQLERAVMNRVNSPKLSVKNSNYRKDYDSSYSKSELHPTNCYANTTDLQEKSFSSKNCQKTYLNHSPEPLKRASNASSSYIDKEYCDERNFVPHYGSFNNSALNCDSENKHDWQYQQSKQNYQQRGPNHHKQMYRKTVPDEQEVRTQDFKHDINMYPQVPRKTTNPAGMFTQINPFHQPSRQKNNAPCKPWLGKEELKKEHNSPINGNDIHYSSAFPKSVQVTTCDSSGRQRSKRDNISEPQIYAHHTSDGGFSKTVLISPYSSSNNQTPPSNFKQIRK